MMWRAALVPLAITVSLSGGCDTRWLGMGKSPNFPREANGWRPVGNRQSYDRRSLYSYMDGAGELYLAYDFQRLYVREYAREGAPRIVAEAYEMATSEDAFGVFTNDREGEDVGVGQGCAYAVGLLRFWQGAWFFRILAERETPDAKAAVLAIGRALAEPIGDGPLPPILRRLPRDGLDEASVRYFHTAFSLSTVYYLADENLLDLSARTEAAFATYRRAGERLHLLVVRYKNAQQAGRAYHAFNRIYLKDKPPPAGPGRIEAVEEGRHLGVLVHGQFVAVVLEAPSREACDRLLTEAERATSP